MPTFAIAPRVSRLRQRFTMKRTFRPSSIRTHGHRAAAGMDGANLESSEGTTQAPRPQVSATKRRIHRVTRLVRIPRISKPRVRGSTVDDTLMNVKGALSATSNFSSLIPIPGVAAVLSVLHGAVGAAQVRLFFFPSERSRTCSYNVGVDVVCAEKW